jgi:hypothetical protein
LRAGDIGSISAWLPSRRSTAHHRGAAVITRFGQVRSGNAIGVKGTYLWIGIRLGCWAVAVSCGVILVSPLPVETETTGGRKQKCNDHHRGEGAGLWSTGPRRGR